MPAAGRMGDECESPEDCTSGLCATVEGYAFCTRACDSANCTCPSDYACREAAGGTMVCAMVDMPDADEPSGCGCALVGQGGGLPPAALLLAALLLVGLLRRKV
jgi:MYXO-CTERM domain-containing protein